MAASRGLQVPVTSPNVAFLLFGHHLYSEYLEFQSSIVLPRSSGLYRSTKAWIEACFNSQLVPHGHLPNPQGYKAFMHWLHARGKLFKVYRTPTTTRLVIAKLCGHAMHPAIRSSCLATACPVCTMEQITWTLTRAWQTWKALGAPDRRLPYDPKGSSRELYHILKDIWRFEKNRWVGLVYKYEELSKGVVAWEDNEMRKASPAYTFEELTEAKSVLEALHFARRNDPHRMDSVGVLYALHSRLHRRTDLRKVQTDVTARDEAQEALSGPSIESGAPLSDKPLSPPHTPSPSKLGHAYPPLPPSPSSSSARDSSSPSLVLSPPRSPIRERKAVTFAVDVLDNKKRRGYEFRRTSGIYYRPGRYACPSEDGWADTSFCCDEDFEYDNELDKLEENHQRFLALFAPRSEDTDPTVDEGVFGDTESDTDSEDSSSGSDSGSEPAEELEEVEDPLAEAIMHSMEVGVEFVGDSDHATGTALEVEPNSSGAPSEHDVQMLDAVCGLSDATLQSYLLSSGLCSAEQVEEGLHMVDDARSMDGASQSYPLADHNHEASTK
ncbi:uncharacterized protein N0V89_003345 [Didymosphaeria variabile]|uniref:Uncharacterized protein n=1 Tax=Didymosphaeria variabile TaxID=1932322 RepID=A0A9W9CEI0_9PLEO|nr:uncharacterized protein N0V89_003345 [Didymosphaeria variabile]KAJ4358761.1 hypothetical protein N0V89_003345 [Didymosphaeria variabile]